MGVVVQPDDVVVAAPPELVWDVLADFSSYAAWSPSFRVRGTAAGVGTRITVEARLVPGPPVLLPAIIRRSDRGRVLAWGGRVPGLLRAEHAFELTPEGEGTRVRHRESFDGLGAVPVQVVRGLLRREYARMSERLRVRAEALAA